MKVMKFGSATIATADKLKEVAAIVAKEKNSIVVLSSMRGTAESLTEISNYLYRKNQEGAIEIINKLEMMYLNIVSSLFSKEEYKQKAVAIITEKLDYIRTFTKDLFTLFEQRIVMAQGELISSELLHLYLLHEGKNAVLLPALDFMRIDKNATPDQSFLKENLTRMLQEVSGTDVYITQGYVCRNAYGEIDDLQKGGSDYTASLIGAALNVREIQIWAGLDVMQNNDPKLMKQTKTIRQLNFDEAAELTYFGAKILHPTCIAPAKLANIQVRLKNTQLPDAEGTLISNKTEVNTIKAVGVKDHITMINIKSGRMLLAHGFLRRVFEVFEQYQTPIDMLATSEIGISLTIDDNNRIAQIVDDLKKYGIVSVAENMAIVSVVGDHDETNAHFASYILDSIKDIPVTMISYGGSKYNFSFLISKDDKEHVLQILNEKLF